MADMSDRYSKDYVGPDTIGTEVYQCPAATFATDEGANYATLVSKKKKCLQSRQLQVIFILVLSLATAVVALALTIYLYQLRRDGDNNLSGELQDLRDEIRALRSPEGKLKLTRMEIKTKNI